ncbi:MAG: PQQ-binding-like beta-propeller repeat protein, partial [Candidatus Woesearchaeota archaeon]|nr:PQQ-binding-like beta-propeller repeat protein [Candidatus Woesearchaeota archaeon]
MLKPKSTLHPQDLDRFYCAGIATILVLIAVLIAVWNNSIGSALFFSFLILGASLLITIVAFTTGILKHYDSFSYTLLNKVLPLIARRGAIKKDSRFYQQIKRLSDYHKTRLERIEPIVRAHPGIKNKLMGDLASAAHNAFKAMVYLCKSTFKTLKYALSYSITASITLSITLSTVAYIFLVKLLQLIGKHAQICYGKASEAINAEWVNAQRSFRRQARILVKKEHKVINKHLSLFESKCLIIKKDLKQAILRAAKIALTRSVALSLHIARILRYLALSLIVLFVVASISSFIIIVMVLHLMVGVSKRLFHVLLQVSIAIARTARILLVKARHNSYKAAIKSYRSFRRLEIARYRKEQKERFQIPDILSAIPNKKVVPVTFLVIFAVLGIFMLSSQFSLTGFVVYDPISNNNPLNLTLNESQEYEFNLEEGLTSLALSGSIEGTGLVKVYIEHNKSRILVLDSRKMVQDTGGLINLVEPSLASPSIIKDSKNKSININLGYRSGTPYDMDDDGHESLTGIVDISVENTSFNWEVDQSKLCTRWEIYSENSENSTTICNGNEQCCNFVDLAPSSDTWNGIFNLYHGLYGTTDNNTVSAQILYVDFNLTAETPYSDISSSEWQSLPASFSETITRFDKVCEESCAMNRISNSTIKMIFEMQDASITLDWITYKALLILPETISPPILVQDIPNIIVYKDSTAAIDLKKYFKDDDTEYLNYTVNDMENISISIFNNTLEIRPDTNFTGTAFTFITANDSKNIAVSNLFAIEVKTRPLPKEHLQQQPLVILGQPVKWVKKVTVDQPVDNISINVTSDAANITIKKKDKGVEQFVEKQNIKIDYKGDTTTLENYETTKKVEKIDKEIDSLNKKKRTLIPDNKAVRETNIEIIGLKEQKNLITGAVVYDTGQEGIITGDTNQEGMLARFFNWLFTKLDSSITGAVVMEIGEEEYNTTTITIEDELEELEIEYYTDGPTSEETTLSGSTKQVTISSDIHYENILAFTSIRDTPASLIKIFWMVNDTNTLVQPYNLTDTNNNGLIDTVYWLVPHLSNQTYQIIIEISKAEHLDSNRTLIADIYDYVKARDNNFTTISNGEYVRVTFEVPLDSTRDITIYARGNGSILVYEYEGNETVAFFNSIDEEKEYKVYLTNLIGTQDTFDLRISGSIEFDYIVDPLSSESESADEWKTFGRYLNHTHYTSSYAPPNISDTTTVTKDTGSNQFVYPTGVIANDTLFFGTVGGFFYAINASNVSQVINIRDFKEEAGWSDADITDFPAATDDSVYVFVYHDSKDAVLYQLNISNINQTLSKNEDLGSNDAYKEGPVVYNGNVYMVDHYDDKIYQYNASNVSLTIATNDISSSSCDTMPAIANDYLYIGCDDNQMHQLNASNVSQLFETYTTGGDIDSTPAVAGGYLYFGSDDNVIYQLNASNISQQIANYTTGGDVNGNPGVGNGYVYIGSDDFSFYQLNASNISQQIANYTGTTSFPRHSAINDRYVFALSGNNILQLDANNVNNKIAEVVSIHRSNRGPLIAGGYVYLGGGLNQDINQFGTFYPTTILESPIAGLELGSSLQNETFNCSSSDSIGVLNISLYITDINNGSFGLNQTLEVSGTHTAANWTLELDEGNYTWNCLSYDTNNNSDWGVNRTIILDGSSPTITIDAPSNNTFTTDSGLDVTYTAADQNIDSCWYSNDTMGVNTSLASCSTDITDITWTESQHNVTIWANDTKNNVGSSEILFTIDISYPSFTNISNLTAEYATALIFDINATDTTSFDCFKINDTGNFSINCAGSLENNSMLDIMLYWLNVTINDSAGNENSSVIWINVTDTTAPTFTTIANQSVYDLDALGYDIEATDAQNVDCFTINDTDHFKINCSGYLENSTLLNATLYWLNVTINDTTNNTNNEPMFVNVSVKPFFGLDLDYPTANISVTPNTFFNITVNVSCQRGDCDDVNVSLYDTGSNISDVRVAFVCYSASCSDADDLSDYLIDQGFQVTQNRYTSWTDETLNDSAFDVIVVGGNYLVGYYAFDSASDPARDAFEDEAIPTVVALDSGYTGNRMGITSSTTCTTDYSDNDIIDIQTHDIMTGFSGTVYVDTTGDDLCYFTAAQMTDPYTKLFAPEDAGSANIAGYVIDKGDATTGTNPGTLVYLGFDTADTYPDTTGNDSTIIKQATCWAATGSSDCKPLKLVNNTAGATPFYTNITNPYNTTLSNDSSEIVTWWVNASGDSGTLGEFLVHTNKTSDMSIGNITSVWNVTIDSSVDTILPSFDDIDNQTIEYGIALDHDINASDDIAVDCFTVNDTSNFQINCSGYLENNTILNVAVYDLNISVNDTSNNTNYSIIWVNVTADVSPPEFTNMDNQTIDFGSILGYDINATDPNNLSCFEVNDTTTFQINCTGFLENITALSIA